MALADTINLLSVARNQDLNRIVRPAQLASAWLNVITAGGMDDADAGAATNITAPSTEITLSTRQLVNVGDEYHGMIGTTLRVRMGYDTGATLTTSPIIQVFGRTQNGTSGGSPTYDAWKRLLNKNATPVFSVTLTVLVASDVGDGTYKYTECSPADHAFDLDGCSQLLFGVKTAFAVSAGSAATAFMQAKVI